MIDSHAHLIWESFDSDRVDMIQRALDVGVEAFIHPCVHTRDLPQMKELSDQHPKKIFFAAGVHPCDAEEWTDQCSTDIEKYSADLVAIGETGLDFFHKDASPEQQDYVFRKQCEFARNLNLPLIVHCRDAFSETLKVLEEEKVPAGGVMHCYTGDSEYSAAFWDLGFYTSFSGCLTFKNAGDLREAAANIPLERILVETDCPFLAPQKFRGKRNEPSFITEVVSTLAEIHGKSNSEIMKITKQNTLNLFKKIQFDD